MRKIARVTEYELHPSCRKSREKRMWDRYVLRGTYDRGRNATGERKIARGKVYSGEEDILSTRPLGFILTQECGGPEKF